ncbi:MerR family transcriptional regulator [Furfurilactobacillus sp. WILCCON 0119]
MTETYLSKVAAEQTGLSIDTLRFYEKQGLITPIKRDQYGYRQYTKQDIEWLKLVGYLRQLGVSIVEMHQFIDANGGLSTTYHERRLFMEKYQAEVNDKIAALQEVSRTLDAKIELLKEIE